MGSASAHLVALAAYVAGLYCCLAFVMGSFEGGVIFLLFFGGPAFIFMLIYFGIFRAGQIGIAILLVLSIALGYVFANYAAYKSVVALVDQMSEAWNPLKGWIRTGPPAVGIIWAGVTAVLVHHFVYAAIRPRA